MLRSIAVALGLLALILGARAGAEDLAAPTRPAARSAGDGDGTKARANGGPQRTGPVRWIAVGGGGEPSSTEVSLEQDVGLARQVLGAGGVVLFAGGKGARSVRVLRKDGKTRLWNVIADLLDPRPGRDSSYRRPRIAVDGPATFDEVLDRIASALAQGGPPLLLYVATHGEQGERSRDNALHLWGGTLLTVANLAAEFEATRGARPLRMVVTACYSGGFADLAFAAADPERGAAAGERCGLFASQWDEVSSGCDPNPNRRSQEGYGIHFLNALRGLDRGGRPLESGDVDFDHDGRISLLEAHTRARIASQSFGVPTSTSERWLRQAAPQSGERVPVALPEEEAVVAALSRRLELPDGKAARQRLADLRAQLGGFERRLADAEDEEDDRLADLRIALLSHWPVLDDPWHALFPRMFRENRGAIRRFVAGSKIAARQRKATARANRLAAHVGRLRLRAAAVQRLVNAYDTIDLAARLHAAGGAAWEYYERLLACERDVPVRDH